MDLLVGLAVIVLFLHARWRLRRAERSLALLRAVMDETTDAVFVKDAAGRYLLFNAAAARFVGKPVAEVLGQDDAALFEPESARLVRERDLLVMANGVADTREEVLTAAGVTRIYQASKTPLRDADGNVIGIVGISRDITEYKRAAERLQRAEAELHAADRRLADLVREMGEASFVLDAEWRFTFTNDRCHVLLPYSRDQLIGQRIWDVFTQLVGTPMEAHYRRAMRERVPVAFEAFSPVAGRWLDIRVSPSGDGLAAFLLDIDARKRAQQALTESEERYRRLVDVLPAAMILCTEGRITFCNPAMRALVGAADDSRLVGTEAVEIAPPEDRPLVRAHIRSAIETGQPTPVREGRVLRLDGQPVPVTVVTAPVTIDGKASVMAVFSDRTERERSMQRLQSVLESVPDAILTADDHRVVLTASPAAARVFQCAPEALVGRRVATLVPALATAPWPAAACELQGVRPDGTLFPVEVIVAPLAGESAPCFTLLVRDIAERRRLEEQVRQSQKMDAIGRMAGGIAHDFNNAMMVVNGYCQQVLEELPEDSEHRAPIAAVLRAGERATRLTRQLLAFSRRGIIHPVDLNIAELVGELTRPLGRMIGEDIALTVTADPAAGPVHADAGQLEQVLLNLALNAREAMPTGGSLSISVAVVEARAAHPAGLAPGRHVELAVTDSGCGIAPEMISKIFDPFFTTKPFEQAAGLGLAVVHGVVEQLGGRVTVASEVGRGTTFRVYLPIAQAAAAPVATPRPARGNGVILVVEDEEDVRTFARAALQSRGYTVLTAGNAEEAVAAARSVPALGVVLTDVVLPGPNGRQVAERVRALHPGVKVLYMSGHTDDAVLRNGIVEGRDAFLPKPFTVGDLILRLQALLT